MKQIMRKLRSRAGESLMESLLSILIFTLASIAMYTMVSTAADINTRAKEADRIHQTQMVVAEQAETASGTGTISMTMTVSGRPGTVSVASIPVIIYGAEGELYSYFSGTPAAGEGGT